MANIDSDELTIIADGDILVCITEDSEPIRNKGSWLFLMVGPELKLLKTTFIWDAPEAQVSGQTYKFSAWNGTFGKNKMPYAVWNNYDE